MPSIPRPPEPAQPPTPMCPIRERGRTKGAIECPHSLIVAMGGQCAYGPSLRDTFVGGNT